MKQLSGADSIFLSMETPNVYGHVGGLSILDTSEAPDFSFDTLMTVLEERIPCEPLYTMKLQEVQYGLDHPYMVEDPDFAVRNHVRRIGAASPGGIKELAELVGFLHASPLDRTRPLWEMWYIEGVGEGRAAMYMKNHHCLMDGQSGSGMGEMLCDFEPNPSEPFQAPKQQRVFVRYSDFEMGLRAARSVTGAPRRFLGFGGRALRQSAANWIAKLRDSEAPPTPDAVPELPFNAPIGPKRAFACSSVALEDVKKIKNHFDVTVNDVVLALSGSAVREYLRRRDELPEEPLVAGIAISTRKEGDDLGGNQVTTVPVAWATDLGDPVERLLQIHRNADKAKEFSRNYDEDLMAGLGDALPPSLTGLLMQAATAVRIFNVVVSNVRGTPVPLYTAGARIESMYPLSLLADSQGLNLTVVSYMDHVDFGFVADPDLVPDIWDLADGVPAAVEELRKAMESRPPTKRQRRKPEKGS